MLRIEFRGNRPGYVDFKATGWKGGSENIEFCIKSNQTNLYFSHDETWQAEAVWHKAESMQIQDNALVGELGPSLVDSLLQQQTNVRYFLTVRDGVVEDRGPVTMVGEVLSSSAGGNSVREEFVRTSPQPEPVTQPTEQIEEPVSENITESVAVPPVKAKKSLKWLWILLAILVLLIAAATAFWFFSDKIKDLISPTTSQPTTEVSKEETKPEETKKVALTPCELNADGDELAFIQGCLKSKPDTKQILTLIDQAKTAKKCSIAQRLYANQAQSGNVEIAIAYAKEYELGSACFNQDKATAIYWYETALNNSTDDSSNNAELKQKIEELKK